MSDPWWTPYQAAYDRAHLPPDPSEIEAEERELMATIASWFRGKRG